MLATRSVSLRNHRTRQRAKQALWDVLWRHARLCVVGVGAVVLLLVLAAAAFGADYYLVHASAPLLYGEITLNHLQG